MKNSKKYRFLILVCLFSTLPILLISCAKKGSDQYINEIENWHQNRIERLTQPDSWLSLVGLYWLKEGENSFGTDPSNAIVFPKGKAPEFIGKFILKDSLVTVKINSGVNVICDSARVEELVLIDDLSGNQNIMEYGTLSWYLIKRGERYGIRLKDSESKALKNFEGIELFDISKDWKIEAEFEPYDPPKKIEVPSVLGTADVEESPGALVFSFDGKPYKLDALKSGSGFFMIFADKTSGDETYGAGRFLYVDPPDSTGKIYIDFNKSYNPPCAFSKYATCPLPPKQNFLSLAVEAGEKKYSGEH